MITKIITKTFANLEWYEKIIGAILFVPVVIPMAFYKKYISKEW